MGRALLIGVAAVFGLSACGSAATKPSSDGVDASLQVKHVLDSSAGVYTEGSIWHLRVVGSAVDAVLDRDLKTDRVSLQLPAGRYRLESYERPCDGNCGYLDPPMDNCSGSVTAEAGATVNVHVTLKPGQGCTIRTVE
jgi:hypothetical protein